MSKRGSSLLVDTTALSARTRTRTRSSEPEPVAPPKAAEATLQHVDDDATDTETSQQHGFAKIRFTCALHQGADHRTPVLCSKTFRSADAASLECKLPLKRRSSIRDLSALSLAVIAERPDGKTCSIYHGSVWELDEYGRLHFELLGVPDAYDDDDTLCMTATLSAANELRLMFIRFDLSELDEADLEAEEDAAADAEVANVMGFGLLPPKTTLVPDVSDYFFGSALAWTDSLGDSFRRALGDEEEQERDDDDDDDDQPGHAPSPSRVASPLPRPKGGGPHAPPLSPLSPLGSPLGSPLLPFMASDYSDASSNDSFSPLAEVSV